MFLIVLEDGIVSLFLSAATQQLFKCVCDEDATEEKPFIYLKKNEVMFDMKMRAAVSDFSPLKQFIMVIYFYVVHLNYVYNNFFQFVW